MNISSNFFVKQKTSETQKESDVQKVYRRMEN